MREVFAGERDLVLEDDRITIRENTRGKTISPGMDSLLDYIYVCASIYINRSKKESNQIDDPPLSAKKQINFDLSSQQNSMPIPSLIIIALKHATF